MISTPCCCPCCFSRESSASAGGQLEQPSEVNSSTTTALRLTSGDVCGRAAIPSVTSKPNTTMQLILRIWLRSIDIKLHLDFVFHFDRATANRNRLDSEIRLLQFGAAVIMVCIPYNIKAHFPASAVQGQAARHPEVLRRCPLNTRRFKADVRVFLRIQHSGAQHGVLNLHTGGFGLAWVGHL